MINHKFKANRPKIIGDTNIKPYWRVIESVIDKSEVLLEVLDARMPELSRNEELEEIIKKRKREIIFILNKADLVEENELRKTYNKLKGKHLTFIISTKEKMGTKRLREYLIRLSNKNEITIGVVGYPNTGKSSIINSLLRRKKAPVSKKAGTTHGEQWLNSSQLKIIDSPGIIPIKNNDEIRLALIGSKNVEKIKSKDIVSNKIIEIIGKNKILSQYQVNEKSKDPEEIIELIGKKKGFIKKGGNIDEVRTSTMIIRDWQQGKIG